MHRLPKNVDMLSMWRMCALIICILLCALYAVSPSLAVKMASQGVPTVFAWSLIASQGETIQGERLLAANISGA